MRLQTLLLVAAVSFSVVLAGCGGGGGETAETPETTPTTPAPAAEPAGSASIAGTINFDGTAPERPPITLDRDCRELHEGDVLSENTIVNDGKLQWVFVYVKDGLGDRTFATPTEEVVFDQRGCLYMPHVFGVQVGQTVRILNSDAFLHNVNSQPEQRANKFNFGMPNQGMEKEQTFRTAEVMVKIRCDVHGWMGAYAGVLEHPYFAVSGEDGSFSIEGLPAGTYTLEAWHETLGTQTMEVTVADDEAATADFTFSAAS